MPSHKVHDISIRLARRDKTQGTDTDARAALWAAHKIASRGGNVEEEMRDWIIYAVDWKHTYQSGREKTYHYERGGTPTISEVMGQMAGMINEIGLDHIRIGLVDK